MDEFLKSLNYKATPEMENLRLWAYDRHIPVLLEDSERLLDVMVRIKQPRRILEIGTAIGYSGTLMLTAIKDAKLNTIEMSSESIAIAKENFIRHGVYDRVTIFEGDARNIVPMLTGSYDFIFMDGPKGQYIEFLPYLKDLLEDNGVLICDNVLYKGLVENTPDKRHKHITIARNLRSFLEKISCDDCFSSVTLNIGDGMCISIKKNKNIKSFEA